MYKTKQRILRTFSELAAPFLRGDNLHGMNLGNGGNVGSSLVGMNQGTPSFNLKKIFFDMRNKQTPI